MENIGYVPIEHCRLTCYLSPSVCLSFIVHFAHTHTHIYGNEMFLGVRLAKPLKFSVFALCDHLWSPVLLDDVEAYSVQMIHTHTYNIIHSTLFSFRWRLFLCICVCVHGLYLDERERCPSLHMKSTTFLFFSSANETTNKILTFRGILSVFTLATKIHILEHRTLPLTQAHHTFWICLDIRWARLFAAIEIIWR